LHLLQYQFPFALLMTLNKLQGKLRAEIVVGNLGTC